MVAKIQMVLGVFSHRLIVDWRLFNVTWRQNSGTEIEAAVACGTYCGNILLNNSLMVSLRSSQVIVKTWQGADLDDVVEEEEETDVGVKLFGVALKLFSKFIA